MATEKVRIDYKVNKTELSTANKVLNKMRNVLGLTKKAVDQTNEKFKDQAEVTKKLTAERRKLLKSYVQARKDLKKEVADFNILGTSVGRVSAVFRKSVTVVTTFRKVLGTLRVAILATGIGALVIALGAVVTFFTKSQKGSDLLSKAMGVLGAIVDTLVGVVSSLGEKLVSLFLNPQETLKSFVKLVKDNLINRFEGFLELIPQLSKAIKQLFSGDFADAAETAGNAVAKVTLGVEDFTDKAVAGFNSAADALKGLNNELDGAIKGSNEYEALLIKLRKTEIEVTAAVAKRSRIIQDQLIITRDMTRSFEDQKAALDLANRLELANEKDLLDIANQKLAITEKDLANTPIALQTDEQLLAIAQARAETENAIANSTAKQREILNRQVELENRRLGVVRAKAVEEAKTQKLKDDQLKKDEETGLKQAKADAQTLEEQKQAISNLAVFRLEQAGKLEEAETARRRRLLEDEKLIEEERQLIIEESEAVITQIKADAKADQKVLDEKAAADQKVIDDALVASKEQSLNEIVGIAKQVASDGSELGKAAALTAIAQDTGKAIASLTAASEGNPANAVTFGGAGILQFIAGLARIGVNITSAKSVLSAPTSFEKGGRIGGNLHSSGGTLIEAERDEFMMSRKATSKYGFDKMDMINDLEWDGRIAANNTGNINIIDVNPIAEQLKNMHQNIMNVDSEGFTMHQIRGQHTISQKIERYST